MNDRIQHTPEMAAYMKRCSQFGEMTAREAMIYFAGQRDGGTIRQQATSTLIQSALTTIKETPAFATV